MAETPRLALPLIEAAQAQKHVTVNEALSLLDAFAQPVATSATAAAPPASPAEGACYLVPAGASGAWAGAGGKLALWSGGAWTFRAPFRGMVAFIADEGRLALYDPLRGWATARAISPHGAATAEIVLEEEVTLAGGFVNTAIAIPDRAVVIGVSTRTTAAVAGATSYSCGIAGDTAKFGGGLGVAQGATNVGVIGPTAFYAPTPVRLTAAGGNFTGGKVRVAIHALLPNAPLS